MRVIAALTFGFSLLAMLGCKGLPVEDVCAMEADCWLKDCEWTDDACNAQVEHRKQWCISEELALLDALAVSSGEACTRCEDATLARLDCLDNIESCARFRVATLQDGECYQEYQDADSDCENIEQECFE